VVAAVIVLSVGLGIGATATVFTAVNAALLRPLPYADADRLVRIYTDSPPNRFPFSVADYRALEAQQTTFEQVAAYGNRQATFTNGSVAERVKGRTVSPGFFTLLGLKASLGRVFATGDGRPGGPPVVIVGHAFWMRWLGGRDDAIGKPVRLDGVDYTVVGVLAPTAGPLEQGQDFFVAAEWPAPPRKGPFFLAALGRVPKGANPGDAASELHAINRRIFPIWQASYQDDRATWSMLDLKTYIVGDFRATASLALAAVALVWLIACANASNLLVARVAGRRRELAVRTALGASRVRIVRYLLVESAILAGAAAVSGSALAWTGINLFRQYGSVYFPRTQEIALDATAGWTIALLTLSSIALFGIVPALQAGAGRVDEALREEGRTATGGAAVRRVRRVLVAAQFAIATPLLVVGALLLVSLNRLGHVDLGFDTHHIVTAQLTLPGGQRSDAARIAALWDEIHRRVAAVPGVVAAGFADGRPPNDVNNFNNFDLEDAPTPPGQSQPVTPWIAVTPDYFRVLGLSLMEGRLLEPRDLLPDSAPVIVVDRAWARRFFPNRSAVGRRLREGGCTTCPLTTVVGVVNDVKYAGLDKPNEGTVYQPTGASRSQNLIVRAAGDPAAVIGGIRAAIREFDPSLPMYDVATMDEMVDRALDRPRSLSLLIAALACSALALSIVGVYGVMAYHVQQHTKEIGIRIALGGTRRDVLALIVRQGMTVVGIGIAAGLVAAIGLAKLSTTLLFGVGAGDPATIGAVCALLLGTACVACLVPALRVTALPPGIVLRNE